MNSPLAASVVARNRPVVGGRPEQIERARAWQSTAEPWASIGATQPLRVAVIDGPYDAVALSGVLAQEPINLANGSCSGSPASACKHGTFVMGLLGARSGAVIPGLCPDCRLLHIPLFLDERAPWASLGELAGAIRLAVAAGARLVNLSVAILGDEPQYQRDLMSALEFAESEGTVLVVAAGNQGRLATGMLLSHPTTIPVTAVDATQRLLQHSNFGPMLTRRGIAALGQDVAGYAPGGGMTVMSGTSVAAAVATGILAELWAARPNATALAMRAAVALLGPRRGAIPPSIHRQTFLMTLDQMQPASLAPAAQPRPRGGYASLQGEAVMKDEITPIGPVGQSGGNPVDSTPVAKLAHEPTGCSCGAPGGVCTCDNGSFNSRFIYVLGSVDIRFPDQSISEELQAIARKKGIEQGDKEHLRTWCFRVLANPEARYVARRLCWILTVEGHPAYYLSLRDLHDLPILIACLGRGEDDLDLVVGSSSLVPVTACPGVLAPTVGVDQITGFEKRDLVKWVKPPGKPTLNPPSKGKPLASTPEHLFDKLVQSADNLGDTDEWRALNYLAVNYQPLYEQHALMAKCGWTLDSVKVVTSRLWREKHVVDPVFSFTNVDSGVVQKYFVRVDVSHLFPMMVHHLAEYFDR